MSRICGRGSELLEVRVVAGDAKVLDDVGNDAARHVARMSREGDEAVGPEGIRVMAVAAGVAQVFAANLAQAPLQLAAVVGGKFAHGSGGEHKLVAEGGRDGAAGFEQGLQVRLGGELKAERGFAPVLPVGVAAGQQRRFRNPHTILVARKLNFGSRDNHRAARLSRRTAGVKELLDG